MKISSLYTSTLSPILLVLQINNNNLMYMFSEQSVFKRFLLIIAFDPFSNLSVISINFEATNSQKLDVAKKT